MPEILCLVIINKVKDLFQTIGQMISNANFLNRYRLKAILRRYKDLKKMQGNSKLV